MEGFDRWGVGVTAAILPGVNGSELRAFSAATKNALAGGKYAGDVKLFLNMSAGELTKSIKSFNNLITEHSNLIKDPVKYLSVYNKPNNWFNMTSQEQKGLIEKWKKDIQRATDKLNIAKDILTTKK